MKKRRRYRKLMRQGVLVLLCAVILLSAFMVVSIVGRSIRTRRLNRELAERRDQMEPVALSTETPQPVATDVPVFADEPEETMEPAPTAEASQQRTSFHRILGQALPNMEQLYYENRDLTGWIEIPEVLSLPVVYKDNSYYLTHDFYKNKNASGTIFLDKNHRFSEHTQNLLLHGHNMKDGTMFGRLTQYLQDIDYLKRHAFVNYDTLWEKEQYVIFSVMRVSLDVKSDQFINYFSYPTFKSEREFENYVRQAQLHSQYAIPLDIQPSDALLTLSTCIDEDRLVIVCRRIRENESRTGLRQTINLAVRQ
ncbi:MAG: sortase [Clostridia bacterium]|nr:sortase [Clostridia bacterium]